MPHDPEANPPPDQLADDRDEDGWDRDKHGRMLDHQAGDDAVRTVPYEPDSD